MQGKAGAKKAQAIQLAMAVVMSFMVVYYIPGSVLINFYARFHFILNTALGYRHSRYEHHYIAKEEMKVGS